MKLNGPIATNALSLPAAIGVRAWMSTLRYRMLFRDPTIDPALGQGPPRIYLFWHEGILMPLYLRGNCHLSMLLSKHRDADILAKIADRFGFGCVRGSTYRGGARALRELVQASQSNHLTITPDGPRGPRRKLAQGPIYLASKLGMPIVAMGFAYARPWRMNSWDRFAIPKPYTNARGVLSEAIDVPPGLDREGIESWRLRIETLLNELTDDAQSWANSGAHRDGEQPIVKHRGPAPPAPQRLRLRAA